MLPVTLVSIVSVVQWEAEVGFQWTEKIIGVEEMETGGVSGKDKEGESEVSWVGSRTEKIIYS